MLPIRAAALAACVLTLGLSACGPQPGGDGAGAGPSATGRAPDGSGGEAAIGVQPVPNTPVAQLPDHPGHPSAGALAGFPEPPRPSREYFVSPDGNDAADGSQGAPFRTIGKALEVVKPGEAVRVQAGTYREQLVLDQSVAAGRDDAKITLQGDGSPRLVPAGGKGALVQVRRPNWVIDGFELDVQGQPQFAVTFEGDVHGSVLANSELHHGTLGGGITTFNSAKGALILNNHIHDFERTSGNKDSHGVVIQPTSRDITVRNNDIHGNSGDSVQCLGPEGFSKLPPAEGVLVENNHFYGNRENAVDIKTCHQVTVRHNVMHDFRPTSTAKGDVVVVHYSARDVTVEDNVIYDAGKGISVGGNREGPMPRNVTVRRNRLRNLSTQGGGEGSGIRLENSEAAVVVNNTVEGAEGAALVIGHGTGGPTSNLTLRNNILDGKVALNLGGQLPGLTSGHNLFGAGGRLTRGGAALSLADFQQATGDQGSVQADPGLAGEALTPGPAAVDQGEDVGLTYCGSAPDIGAVETGC